MDYAKWAAGQRSPSAREADVLYEETSSARRAAGKRAWKKRVAAARAQGKTHLRIGKRRVRIAQEPLTTHGPVRLTQPAHRQGLRERGGASKEEPPMAKETKKERRAGGKKGFRTRLKNARARGDKTIKIGKRRVPLSEFSGSGSRKKDGGSKAHRKHKGRHKAAAAPKPDYSSRASMRAPKKSRRSRKAHAKGHRKAHRGHHRHPKTVTKLRTVRVKVPGKTRNVYVTAAERRGRRHSRRAREGYAMENPLSTVEIIAGGLTMLLGLAVADVSDRYWATTALVTNAANAANIGG